MRWCAVEVAGVTVKSWREETKLERAARLAGRCETGLRREIRSARNHAAAVERLAAYLVCPKCGVDHYIADRPDPRRLECHACHRARKNGEHRQKTQPRLAEVIALDTRRVRPGYVRRKVAA